jgi:hypothetical protein
MKRGIWWLVNAFKPKASYEAMRPSQQRISFLKKALAEFVLRKRPQEALFKTITELGFLRKDSSEWLELPPKKKPFTSMWQRAL